MIPLSTLEELFDYNYWARDRQLEACRPLNQEQFLRSLGSSFSSLRDTLAHLLGAEWIWQERWQGRSPTRAEAKAFAGDTFPTLEVIRERWQAVERQVREFVASLSEDGLGRPVTYQNLKGDTWSYPLGRTLLHLLNHQSYHRGQVTTLLRQLWVEPPAVDFLVAHDQRFRG